MSNNIQVIEELKIKLYNSSTEFDVSVVDSLVQYAMSGDKNLRTGSQEVLDSFKQHERSLVAIQPVLFNSESTQSQFYALQLLEHVIKSRWQVLSDDDREVLRAMVVGLITKLGGDASLSAGPKLILKRLISVVVEIVKVEWPTRWTSFVTDLIGHSVTNENLCTICMTILKTLSEEIFVYSNGKIMHIKARHLKNQLTANFNDIFQLCVAILDRKPSSGLVTETIEALSRFVQWCPPNYLFETDILPTIIKTYLPDPNHAFSVIELFTEVAQLVDVKYEEQQRTIFVMLDKTLKILFPSANSLEELYKIGGPLQMKFFNKLAVCYSNYMQLHHDAFSFCENQDDVHPAFVDGFQMLVILSLLDDLEIYKSCMEFWLEWSCYIFTSLKSLPPPNEKLMRFLPFVNQVSYCARLLSDISTKPPLSSIREYVVNISNLIYIWKYIKIVSIFPELTRVVIMNMARPEEVIIVETDTGEVIREFMKDTAAIDHYNQCRYTLLNLTQIDPISTRDIMESILVESMNCTQFSWKKVNTLCWSVGSISGVFSVEEERRFIVTVIRELLALCEKMSGKNNKALVASNIMYVVRKYPRFLNSYWKFLSTVVNKLFEFMHELHEGVQDMSCDTFMKISQKCAHQFVILQEEENGLFAEKICSQLNNIICDLQPHQVYSVYKSIGFMLRACPNLKEKQRLLDLLLENSNNEWRQLLQKCLHNNQAIFESDTLDRLSSFLKLNCAVSSSLDDVYELQMSYLEPDLSRIYQILSERISQTVLQQGDHATKLVVVKRLRSVKRETLKLLEHCVKNSSDVNVIMCRYVPFIVNTVLPDYETSANGAKDPELLILVDTLVCQLKEQAKPFIPAILKFTFNSTVTLIDKDFMEYPEHRRHFFKLLESISSCCFTALIELPQGDMDLVVKCVIWAFKHSMPDVAETGLKVLFKLFHNFSLPQYCSLPISQNFFQAYYVSMMTHILSIITDSTQASVIEYHARIIASMIVILESNILMFPLFPDIDSNVASNTVVVKNYLVQLIGNAFNNLLVEQVKVFIEGLFALTENKDKFVVHLTDFILQTKIMQAQGSKDLFIDEYISELQSELNKKNQQRNIGSSTIHNNSLSISNQGQNMFGVGD